MAKTPRGATKQGAAAELMRRLHKMDYDPLEQLIELAGRGDMSTKELLKLNEILMQYRYPKLKALEIDQKTKQTVSINLDLGDVSNGDNTKGIENLLPNATVTELDFEKEKAEARAKHEAEKKEESQNVFSELF